MAGSNGRECALIRILARSLSGLAISLWIAGCGGNETPERTTIRFWAMGREGEVVAELARSFEIENPSIRIEVQQMPWTAAHEKLLTAFVGRSTPDLAQLGNTWLSEFHALEALEPLDDRVAASAEIDSASYFTGIWDTNRIDGKLVGIPWYVDTRVLFYRKDVLAQAGYDSLPATWGEWRAAMEQVKRVVGPERYAILLPLNEWPPVVILGLQAGSSILADGDTRGAFREPAFREGFAWYVDLFRGGLAPPVRDNEIANLYQEFGRSTVNMYITGPWNLGEFSRRLPPELQDDWATAPLPGPDPSRPGVSLAGGSSLILFRASPHKDEAWRFIEFLSRPDQQARFFRASGDLPARVEAWDDSSLTADPHLEAFRVQLGRVVSTPKIPEWEQIASRIQDRAELAVRGSASLDEVLEILDGEVDRILEKRRWLLERTQAHVTPERT